MRHGVLYLKKHPSICLRNFNCPFLPKPVLGYIIIDGGLQLNKLH